MNESGNDDGIKDVTHYVRAAHEQVGEPGAGNRWHDRVYRICDRLLRSRPGRRFPRWARERISHLLNYTLIFHQHEINKAWSPDDPLNNFAVPENEHVEIPSIWVVELFPPSEYHSLARAIERHSWDKQRVWYGLGEPANQTALDRSRTGAGYPWWRLGTVSDPSSGFIDFESVRRVLPTQFSTVALRALQVGAGLTAVVARFTVRPEASAELDQVWHEVHQPHLHRTEGRRPVAEDRQFAAYRRTQNARRQLHQAARNWVASTCPGLFASYGEDAPLLDLLLLESYDPTAAASVRDEMSEPMRALGLTDYEIRHQTSDTLPGLLLERVREELTPGLESRRTWTLLGRRATVICEFGERLVGTQHDSRGLSYVIGESVSDFLILLAGDCFVDTARTKMPTVEIVPESLMTNSGPAA